MATAFQKLLIAQRREERERELASRPPGNAGAQGRRICIECLHHTCDYDWRAEKVVHNCSHPALRHLVTGRPTDPYLNRQDEKGCGRAATYWMAAPVQQRPATREREVFSESPPEFIPPVPVRRIDVPYKNEVVAVLWAPLQR